MTAHRALGVVFCALLLLGATGGTSWSLPYAYVTTVTTGDDFAKTIAVLDTETNAVVDTIDVPRGAVLMAVHPDGTRLYASGPGYLSVIDTLSSRVSAEIELEGGGALAVSPDGREVYVITNGRLVALNPENNEVLRTAELEPKPGFLAAGRAGKFLYVAHGTPDRERRPCFFGPELFCDSPLSILDARTLSPVAILEIGDELRGIAVTPDESEVYIGGRGIVMTGQHYAALGVVFVVSVSERRVAQQISLSLGPAVPGPVQVSPNGERLYINDLGDSVAVIDRTSKTVVSRLLEGEGPLGFALVPSGATLYVVSLSGGGTVKVIDASTNEVVESIPLPGAGSIVIGPAVISTPLPTSTATPEPPTSSPTPSSTSTTSPTLTFSATPSPSRTATATRPAATPTNTTTGAASPTPSATATTPPASPSTSPTCTPVAFTPIPTATPLPPSASPTASSEASGGSNDGCAVAQGSSASPAMWMLLVIVACGLRRWPARRP